MCYLLVFVVSNIPALTVIIHLARHTFATCMLANGVSIESIAKMLGHSDTKMTRHYARILDSTVYREMQNVQGALGRIGL